MTVINKQPYKYLQIIETWKQNKTIKKSDEGMHLLHNKDVCKNNLMFYIERDRKMIKYERKNKKVEDYA